MLGITEENKKNFTFNELNVWEYIEKNPKNILKINIQKLAKITFTSPSTIVRMCKKIGLEGFNNLKYKIKSELENSKNSSLALEGLLSDQLSFIKEMISTLSIKDLEKVVELLCEDKKIHIFARGLTEMPFSYMYNILLSVDKYCIQYKDPPIILAATSQMSSEDILIIGSSQGMTEAVINPAKKAKEKGATVIVITSNKDSQLVKIADIVLLENTSKRYFQSIDITSRMNITIIVEIILNMYLSKLSLNNSSLKNSYINLKNW